MPLVCSARGGGPVTEGFAALDDNLVQFMLVKFPVGSGTFKRNKFVYVHHIGPGCGAVKRGRWNAELENALKLFNTAAGLTCSDGKASLTFESLVTKLQKVFVADDGTFDLNKIKEEYMKRLEEEKAKMATASAFEAEPLSPIRPRKLATDLGATLPMVLKALSEDFGPFNWLTVDPPKPGTPAVLREAGSNGLFELLEHLPADKVLLGVVRIAFGTGRFRRTKRIFFQWNGDAASAVAKGRVTSGRGEAEAQLGPCNATITINGAEEGKLEAILAKLEHTFVVDHIKTDDKPVATKMVSAEEYIKALEEEQRATSEFYEEPADYQSPVRAKPCFFDIEETLKLVRQDDGGLTWAVLQVA